jgi:ABC-2 type transport system ATP-binding protein
LPIPTAVEQAGARPYVYTSAALGVNARFRWVCLILDEPLASLDPLARREFLRSLMEIVAAQRISVVLSSHLIADLERVCDYLVVLVASRVQVAGEVSELLSSHHRLSGPRRDARSLPANQEVIEESHTDKQSTFLVRTGDPGTTRPGQSGR